jgi:hypothetical protein
VRTAVEDIREHAGGDGHHCSADDPEGEHGDDVRDHDEGGDDEAVSHHVHLPVACDQDAAVHAGQHADGNPPGHHGEHRHGAPVLLAEDERDEQRRRAHDPGDDHADGERPAQRPLLQDGGPLGRRGAERGQDREREQSDGPVTKNAGFGRRVDADVTGAEGEVDQQHVERDGRGTGHAVDHQRQALSQRRRPDREVDAWPERAHAAADEPQHDDGVEERGERLQQRHALDVADAGHEQEHAAEHHDAREHLADGDRSGAADTEHHPAEVERDAGSMKAGTSVERVKSDCEEASPATNGTVAAATARSARARAPRSPNRCGRRDRGV